jgi:hypothetical protein
MLVRIDVDRGLAVSVIRVHGGLDDGGLGEFQRTLAGCAGAGGIELDLAELRNLDAVSTAYLQGLVHAGVRVRRANPYVQSLLSPPAPKEAVR